MTADHRVVQGDNLRVLAGLADASVDLVYVDPPFNTGRARRRRVVRAERVAAGGTVGFGGQRYRRTVVAATRFEDRHEDYLAFLEPRLREAHRVLAPHGSFYLHLDYREVHYVKVLMDAVFGRAAFLNEIVWAYDYGGRPRDRWPAKHDTILFYAKEPGRHVFDREAVERIPYMAPGLVSPEKAARGKLPTDTWWHTIVPTRGREKTGYPTQKPLGILERIVRASSRPGDLVLDFFAGSGTTGVAALRHGRRFLLVDDHPAAIRVMRRRFAGHDVAFERLPRAARGTRAGASARSGTKLAGAGATGPSGARGVRRNTASPPALQRGGGQRDGAAPRTRRGRPV